MIVPKWNKFYLIATQQSPTYYADQYSSIFTNDLQIRSHIDEVDDDELNTYDNSYIQAANLCDKYYNNKKT